MSSSHIKKEEELHFTKKFLDEIDFEFNKDDLVQIPAGHGPDFKLISNKVIGLEVTSYQQMDQGHSNSIRKSTETEWFGIRYELTDKCKEVGLSNLSIHIITKRDNGISFAPSSKSRSKFISELLNLVKKESSELKVREDIFLNNQNIYTISSYLGGTLKQIRILRIGTNDIVDWHFSNLHGGVAGFSDYELEYIINNKKKKIDTYNKITRDELWLLIYSNNESPASTGSFVKDQVQLLAERNIKLLIHSGFDNVWYYNSFYKPFAFRLHPL